MQIKLADGTVLEPILAAANSRYVQGQHRDTLSFVFPATADYNELDAAFSEANCETITIIGADSTTIIETIVKEDGTTEDVPVTVPVDAVHKGYTLRCELKKEPVMVASATTDEDAVYEDRIFVAMSQRTYSETVVKNLQETVDLLVLESLMEG